MIGSMEMELSKEESEFILVNTWTELPTNYELDLLVIKA